MSQAGILNDGGTPAPDIETLSAENGAHTAPSGNNFNFSGSIAGGASANGAIIFSTPANGQMDGAVQVDNNTIFINSSNQLQVKEGLKWRVIGASQTAVAGEGYIINGGLSLTITLPASAANSGESFGVYALTGSTWSIAQGAGQAIQVGSSVTTAGPGGSVTSTKVGDAAEFIAVVPGPLVSYITFPYTGNFTIV